jgi:4-amino-4-deoxy-L-arabinose transferase-like glycosyltransferase
MVGVRARAEPVLAVTRSAAGARAVVVGLTLFAAALRVPTLHIQSFWDDEGYTVDLMRMSFGQMLTAVPKTESTPYPYYVLAWAWTHLFGTGEWGLRLLSALFGVALVPVVYATATRIGSGSRRAGTIASAFVAANPLLIWYSQEGRVYSLLAFLIGLSLLGFVAALRGGSRRAVVGWCVASVLALFTHYFAVFAVVPEAAALLARRRGRDVVAAVGVLAFEGLALLPLALKQRDRGYQFHNISLATRVLQIPEQFVVGYGVWSTPAGKVAAAAAAAIVGLGLVLLTRHRSSVVAASAAVVAAGLALPLVLAPLRLDYVLTLYFIGLLAPVLTLAAVGLANVRAGAVGSAILVCVCVGVYAAVETHSQFQREDLRGAARALAPAYEPMSRAIVVTPPSLLRAYLPRVTDLPSHGADVREVDLVALSQKEPGEPPVVPRAFNRRLSVPGFRLVGVRYTERFTVVRFRAKQPRHVTAAALRRSRIRGGNITRTDVLLDP